MQKIHLIRIRITVIASLFLLFITSEFTQAKPPADMPELFVNDNAVGITIQGPTIYWYTSCGDDFSPGRSRLRGKARTAPSSVGFQTLYFPPNCQADRVASANVALDDTTVYWLTGNGHVVSLSRSADGITSPTEISRTERTSVGGYPSCCSIAVDNTYIFWNEGSRIYRVAKAGGSRESIYSGSTDIRDLTAGGDGTLFFREGSTLRVLTPASSNYVPIHIADGVAAYALSAQRVYFGTNSSSGYAIMSKRRTNDDLQTHYTSDTSGNPSVDALTVDNSNVYWHERRYTGGGPIYRLPRAGRNMPAALTSYLNIIGPLLTDGTYLLWTDLPGIYRLQVGASTVAAPNGDIRITGIEVTQGVQTTDNLIPLVAYKVTFVRVYVQSTDDSNGPWSNVFARADVEGSSRVHGSRAITVSPAGSDRRTLNDSFLFVLDRTETAPGTRNILVTIFPPLGRPETDLTNNTVDRRLTFVAPIDLTITGFAYANSNNGASCTSAAATDTMNSFTEAMRQFDENTYPTANFSIIPFPTTDSFDNSDCEASNRAVGWASGQMDRLYPLGGRRGYVLTPENGLSGWCCNGTAGGNLVALGLNDNPYDPGTDIAHEIAHSWLGAAHSDDPGTHYPHAGGGIGPQVGIRIYPAVRTMPGENSDGTIQYYDILANPSPMWISPYTYCRLLTTMSTDHVPCPASASIAQLPSLPILAKENHPNAPRFSSFAKMLQTEQVYLYMSGYLNPDGTASFDPFEMIKAKQNISSNLQGQTYSLRYEDGNGKLLAEYKFDANPIGDGRGPHGTEPTRFSMYQLWDLATKRIVLLRDGKALTSRTVSSTYPQNMLTTPRGGENWSGEQSVSWTANDIDGDHLTYSVWYSINGGETWLPLDINLTNTSLNVNFDNLPGSDKAMIRVLASDGVNTTEARSAVFVVPRKKPRVSIDAPGEGTTIQQGDEFAAQGYGIDLEDGPIVEPRAYSWTSDLDGNVGYGPWTVLRLSPGNHTIILTVTDSNGQSASATVHVTINALQIIIPPTKAPTLTPTSVPFLLTGGKVNVMPPSYAGLCPANIVFKAILTAQANGKFTYRWEHNDSIASATQKETIGKSGTATVSQTWKISASGIYSNVLHLLTPNDLLLPPAQVTVTCVEPTATQVAPPTIIPVASSTATQFVVTNLPSPSSKVSGIKTSVTPTDYKGTCPTTFTFTGDIFTDGPANVTYRWERSDGSVGKPETLNFAGAGTQSVKTSWTLGSPGETTSGYQLLHVFAPNNMISDKGATTFNVSCG